jgi:hypothetical protein
MNPSTTRERNRIQKCSASVLKNNTDILWRTPPGTSIAMFDLFSAIGKYLILIKSVNDLGSLSACIAHHRVKLPPFAS